MANRDTFNGLLKVLQVERAQNSLAKLSTALTVAGGATTRCLIDSYVGPQLPKGAKIIISKRGVYVFDILTVTSEVNTGDTQIDVSSFTPSTDYPVGSFILIDNTTKVENSLRKYFTVHLNGTFNVSSSTTTNDYLGTLSQGVFTSNGGSVFADGNNKGNNFGGRYGMLNAFGSDFKIHEIKTNIITNIPSGTNIILSFWKKEFDTDGSDNSQIHLVCQNTCASAGSFNNGTQFHDEDLDETTNGQFSADDILIPTIRIDKTQSNSKVVYFDTQVVASCLYK